jgi:uncharacterized protein YtpQ (UPF0354 family)
MSDIDYDPGCLLPADWPTAARAIRPALLPADHDAPLVTGGPAGLAVAYVVAADGAEIQVAPRHLLAWGVEPRDVQSAAMANLAAWSESAAWVDEVDGRRRLVWSESGEGMDAARILLAGVRSRLARELGSRGRVLVAMPERDLLIATGAARSDSEFEALFADYVTGRAQAADRPIDTRIFELVDGELVDSGIEPRA